MLSHQLNKKFIYFRCDANFKIGQGHLMRCLNLADAFAKNSDLSPVFIVSSTEQIFLSIIENRGYAYFLINNSSSFTKEVQLIVDFVKKAQSTKGTIIVLDNYDYTNAFENELKENGLFVCSIDDIAHRLYAADVLINHNIYAHNLKWQLDENTKCLLGASYILLHPDFFNYRRKNVVEKCKHILITMGGGSLGNKVSLRVLQSLENITDVDFSVTVVASNEIKTRQDIEDFAKTLKCHVSIKSNVTIMPALMKSADLVIGAGGTLAYEFAASGLPAIVLVLGENQEKIAEYLSEKGICRNLGKQENVSQQMLSTSIQELVNKKEERLEMMEKGLRLFPKEGVSHVVNCILECQKQAGVVER